MNGLGIDGVAGDEGGGELTVIAVNLGVDGDSTGGEEEH